MKLVRSGERENRCGGLTFDELVERHWEPVYRLVYHLAGNVHDAQDLAQETFLKAISSAGSFREGTNLKAWLLRIASNGFMDQRRKARTAKAAPMADEPPAALQRDAAQDGELAALLSAAIARLDETQRTVFLLRTQDDLSFRDIADVIETTEDTARWHMMQARRKLMKDLDGKV